MAKYSLKKTLSVTYTLNGPLFVASNEPTKIFSKKGDKLRNINDLYFFKL